MYGGGDYQQSSNTDYRVLTKWSLRRRRSVFPVWYETKFNMQSRWMSVVKGSVSFHLHTFGHSPCCFYSTCCRKLKFLGGRKLHRVHTLHPNPSTGSKVEVENTHRWYGDPREYAFCWEKYKKQSSLNTAKGLACTACDESAKAVNPLGKCLHSVTPELLLCNTWCVQVLRSPKEEFAAAMQSWRERCEKCVCLQGDYVEKWLHFQLPVVSSFFK